MLLWLKSFHHTRLLLYLFFLFLWFTPCQFLRHKFLCSVRANGETSLWPCMGWWWWLGSSVCTFHYLVMVYNSVDTCIFVFARKGGNFGCCFCLIHGLWLWLHWEFSTCSTTHWEACVYAASLLRKMRLCSFSLDSFSWLPGERCHIFPMWKLPTLDFKIKPS